jgi:hypothetical protein
MATAETDITHAIQIAASKKGARLFKNVRGLFYTLGEVKELLAALGSGNTLRISKAVRALRQVRAGLQAEGSSDLIGPRPLLITQEMVGTTIAVFSVIEVKTPTGTVQGKQDDFMEFVRKIGGFAGVARSPEEALKILNYPID